MAQEKKEEVYMWLIFSNHCIWLKDRLYFLLEKSDPSKA